MHKKFLPYLETGEISIAILVYQKVFFLKKTLAWQETLRIFLVGGFNLFEKY